MPESGIILESNCPNCSHRWMPYGNQKYTVPTTGNIECPKCHHKWENHWHDSETLKLLDQKELGLLNESELKNEVDEIKTKFSFLQQELDLEKKKLELFEAKLNQILEWKKIREQDFLDIEGIAQELRDDEDFREEHK